MGVEGAVALAGANTAASPLLWQVATVKSIKQETPRVSTITLTLPNWTRHRPGQHYDVRLTAPDGYAAQRSYSVASEPERSGEIDLTVERLDDGEVSPYLHDALIPGDQVQVRGPIGGHFVWEAQLGGPLLLVAGGSGIVPLMAMLRHRARAGARIPTRLLYSSRTPQDVIFYQELERLNDKDDGLQVLHTFTRSQPTGWTGYARRIDEQMLRDVVQPLGLQPQVFICGPTALVETVADALVRIGIAPALVKTERFGPTGN